MTLTFFTNHIHHHQTHVADVMYEQLGDGYKYVEMEPMPEWMKKGGFDDTIQRPYLVRAYMDAESEKYAQKLMMESDVVIIGSAPDAWANKRKAANLVTFHYNERWFKNTTLDRALLGILKNIVLNHLPFRNKRTYMLCASAFTARDVHKVFCYPDKTFKWGYFTKVKAINVNAKFEQIKGEQIKMMWCARFLDWKHPELPVLLASKLKDNGYNFHIDMFGSGVEYEKTVELANKLDVADVVSFCGNKPNEEILQAMRNHEIFLFTSDRGEGWGAVLSEAMANGCLVVAGDEIGSAPYLVQDGENGLLFKSNNLESLLFKVTHALSLSPNERKQMAEKAISTMCDVWNPFIAATRFLSLADGILNNKPVKFADGPCSIAD